MIRIADGPDIPVADAWAVECTTEEEERVIALSTDSGVTTNRCGFETAAASFEDCNEAQAFFGSICRTTIVGVAAGFTAGTLSWFLSDSISVDEAGDVVAASSWGLAVYRCDRGADELELLRVPVDLERAGDVATVFIGQTEAGTEEASAVFDASYCPLPP